MIKTIATAAAFALAAAAPVAAQDVNNDPFVSTQGSMGMGTGALVAAGVAVAIIAIAAVDSSDDT
ncbi:hypothetical protein D6850_16300 [Roseovarius spongiae]|uniref:Ferrochelatase n=1 Tax=Roseovarius spongiae TaxID=2320272 RepID=A0A3A8B7U0_9RHOB|nr:hypothetical protein [Roseovarius spongiae]RKF13059.1 hypothetical protein D6850_16300 [Roseovarius spongiae]